MKRVLCVFGSLERSGAQLRTLEVCRALRQQAAIHFDFCVLGLGPIQLREEIASLGGQIHSIALRSPRFVGEFSALLANGGYEIVSSFPMLWSGPILWLAQRRGTPVRIANFRNSLGTAPGLTTHPAYVWLMRRLIRRSATHVVAVSQAALSSVFPVSWQRPNRCQVIYNGLPLAALQGPADPQPVRAEFGWPSDCRILINVARFAPQKNHRTLLAAARQVYQTHPNIRLLLVGGVKPGDEVVQQVADAGLQAICTLTGRRTDVPRLLRAADLFLFPSLWEGLPGALLEALAAGLPAVASDIPPIREVAQHFPAEQLRLAPAPAAERHAEQIRQALAQPPDRAAAQQHFAQRTPFVLERAVAAYRALYGLDCEVT